MTPDPAVSVDDAADLVRQLYRAFLDREPSEVEVAIHEQSLRLGDATRTVLGIVRSDEALIVRERMDEPSPPPAPSLPDNMIAIDRADLAEVVGRALALGRQDAPSAYEIDLRLADVDRGASLATVLQDGFRMTPPSPENPEDEASIDRAIDVIYRLALGRVPGEIDFETWRGVIVNGARMSDMICGIAASDEATLTRGTLDIVPGMKVQLAFDIVMGRGASAVEVNTFRALVDRRGLDIAPLVWKLFNLQAKKRMLPSSPFNDPRQAYIFGSRGSVNIADWQFSTKAPRKTTPKHDILGPDSVVRLRPPADDTAATPDTAYTVSIVTSLYRGGAFIRSFLENITAQTIFRTHCELIIVDAASPEGEQATIEEFCRDHPNIVYKRMPTRIGIYEAWNVGVALARGRYITNANIDDIRRSDSIEIQAAILDTFDFVDVAYQDVFYCFEPRLPFAEIERRDFRTDLPVVSRYNLMEFNSPHNAPMWRAALHRDVGLFNQALYSAGDFDFWLRCQAAGKTFYKTNEAHAAYFVNPDGISTRPDTRGVVEADAVSRDLYRTLVSPLLTIADDDFLARVDMVGETPLRSGRRYDIVQSALIALGTQRTGAAA